MHITELSILDFFHHWVAIATANCYRPRDITMKIVLAPMFLFYHCIAMTPISVHSSNVQFAHLAFKSDHLSFSNLYKNEPGE